MLRLLLCRRVVADLGQASTPLRVLQARAVLLFLLCVAHASRLRAILSLSPYRHFCRRGVVPALLLRLCRCYLRPTVACGLMPPPPCWCRRLVLLLALLWPSFWHLRFATVPASLCPGCRCVRVAVVSGLPWCPVCSALRVSVACMLLASLPCSCVWDFVSRMPLVLSRRHSLHIRECRPVSMTEPEWVDYRRAWRTLLFLSR